MRYIGLILIAVGLALAAFLTWSWFSSRNKVVSPVPESSGVKVIFVTPSE